MNIIFAGTPKFALPAFENLLSSKHRICAVYTKPDRPVGRGLHLLPSPVKEKTLALNLPILQPENFKNPAEQEKLIALQSDIFIDVAYGVILPREILNLPRYGCINIHPSLLPRWRGAAPIQRAILAGDKVTGCSIMRMDEGLDTGDILLQENMAIQPDDTAATLENNLAKLGATLLLKVLDQIEQGTVKEIKQPESGAIYAEKLSKEEALIDWNKSAVELDQMVRALNPWPVAFTKVDDITIRIFRAIPLSENSKTQPGTILHSDKNGIDIATGQGVLRLLEIQLPGGKVLPVSEILKSKKDLFAVGIILS
ncbi:MAG: methionyl-tRNA formyltransferase [Gammaproteobacteria bacterium]